MLYFQVPSSRQLVLISRFEPSPSMERGFGCRFGILPDKKDLEQLHQRMILCCYYCGCCALILYRRRRFINHLLTYLFALPCLLQYCRVVKLAVVWELHGCSCDYDETKDRSVPGSSFVIVLVASWQHPAGMCRIDFLKFWFGLNSILKKNSDSVWNEFGMVQFEKRSSVRLV